jgi:hypothetical protein
VRWDMLVSIGQPGIPTMTHDPTVPWPSDRKEVKAGTLTLLSAMPGEKAESYGISLDPLPMADGIEPIQRSSFAVPVAGLYRLVRQAITRSCNGNACAQHTSGKKSGGPLMRPAASLGTRREGGGTRVPQGVGKIISAASVAVAAGCSCLALGMIASAKSGCGTNSSATSSRVAESSLPAVGSASNAHCHIRPSTTQVACSASGTWAEVALTHTRRN